MSYEVPSSQTLAERAGQSIRMALPGSDTTLRVNNLSVVAKAWGLLLHEVHLRLRWIYRQIFVGTADGAHLDQHAADNGLARLAAARATGSVTVAGAASTVYPAGLRYLVGGQAFVTMAAVTADPAGNATLPVRAELPGAAGNLPAGTVLQFAEAGINPALPPTALVAAGGTGGGADREADDLLRERILEKRRNPPQGGSVPDYQRFAREVPGVTRAWAAQMLNAPGSVVVWFLFTGRPNGIPIAADVAAVQAHLEAKRRVAVAVVAAAPVPVAVNITIGGLAPDTSAVRAAIAASLAATFARRAQPGRPSESVVFSRSWIVEAIAAAAGEASHELVAPATSPVLTSGQYPVLGTIAYV